MTRRGRRSCAHGYQAFLALPFQFFFALAISLAFVFFDHLFPANLIKLFRRQEIWIHVRSPTPHVLAIHANRFRFKLLLTSAPRLREVVFFRVVLPQARQSGNRSFCFHLDVHSETVMIFIPEPNDGLISTGSPCKIFIHSVECTFAFGFAFVSV